MNHKTLLDYIILRFSESSTWRGLILLVSAGGMTLDLDKAAAIVAAGLGLVGVINVFRKSK